MILKRGLLGLILVGSFASLATPVVAGSGWVFLKPPEALRQGEGDAKSEVHAPLSHWGQVKAFDTARDCEVAKNAMWELVKDAIDTQLPYPPYPEFRQEQLPLQSRITLPWQQRGLTLSERNDEVDKEMEKETKKRETMLAEEQKQQREHAESEWRKAREKVDTARKSKHQATYEIYRRWKCVPADAVYQAPK